MGQKVNPHGIAVGVNDTGPHMQDTTRLQGDGFLAVFLPDAGPFQNIEDDVGRVIVLAVHSTGCISCAKHTKIFARHGDIVKSQQRLGRDTHALCICQRRQQPDGSRQYCGFCIQDVFPVCWQSSHGSICDMQRISNFRVPLCQFEHD